MNVLKRFRHILVAAALIALGGCGSMLAQNPSGALKPVNAVADAGESSVMLKGHDVVSYFTDGRHALGEQRFESVYEGVTFRFASAEHKALFDAAPSRYLPQFNGYCANGIAYAIPWGGDADTWTMMEGRLLIFGGQGSKDAFMLAPQENLALADKYWREEVNGSNSFWQRTKRLILRVPHYKSGKELAQEVAAAKAKGG